MSGAGHVNIYIYIYIYIYKKCIQNFGCNIKNKSTDLRRICDWISKKLELKVSAWFDWLNIRFGDSTHFAKIHFNIYYIKLLHSVSSLQEKNCPSARCTPVINIVYKAKINLGGGMYFYFYLPNCLIWDENSFCMADLLVTIWYCFPYALFLFVWFIFVCAKKFR